MGEGYEWELKNGSLKTKEWVTENYLISPWYHCYFTVGWDTPMGYLY